jgi:predicted permease
MSSLITAFSAIILPILLGILSRTGNFIPAKNRPLLQQFAVRITVPALIFSSLRTIDAKTAGQFIPMSMGLFLFLSITWLSLWGLISLIQKKSLWVRKYRSELLLILFTGNIGYVCWKLHEMLIGVEGLQRGIFYTALYWPFLLVFAFLTVLVFGLSRTKELNKKEFAYNIVPILSSVLIGLIVGVTGLETPSWFNQFLESFGSIAIPLILFCMGLSISFRKSVKVAGPLFPILVLRLLVWGFATYIMLKMPWYDDASRKVLMINALAPLGVNPIVISDMFGMDTEFIANATIISTILFLFMLPGMFLLLG